VFLELAFGTVPALPAPGEEIFTGQFGFSCGGAVSVASAASAVGAKTGLATVLGEDYGARLVQAHCTRAGVDTSISRRIAGDATGVTVAVNYDGDRAFISHLPDDGVTMRDASWWPVVLRSTRPEWIYLHASEQALPVIREARRLRCRVAVDTALRTVRGSPEAVLRCAALADVFLPNRTELASLTGTDDLAGAVALIAAPLTTIIVKDGADGAVLAHKGDLKRVADGLRDVEVQDRTGAGDAFAGALLGSLACGRDLVSAVAAGNAAGSQAVGWLGGVGVLDEHEQEVAK